MLTDISNAATLKPHLNENHKLKLLYNNIFFYFRLSHILEYEMHSNSSNLGEAINNKCSVVIHIALKQYRCTVKQTRRKQKKKRKTKKISQKNNSEKTITHIHRPIIIVIRM